MNIDTESYYDALALAFLDETGIVAPGYGEDLEHDRRTRLLNWRAFCAVERAEMKAAR